MPSERLDAAIRYHSLGYSVIPAAWPIRTETGEVRCSCGRLSCASPGKHPLIPWAAYQRQRAPREKIVDWWGRRWPQANISIVTGIVSGLVVLDIDPGHGGDESLADLELELGPLPDGPRALTGGGGYHLLFRHPGGGEIQSRAGWRPGIDIRADGGQIIAPPSSHASGRAYGWEAERAPDEFAAPDLPPQYVADIRRHAPIERHGAEGIEGLLTRHWPEGERNSNLTRVAGWLIAAHRDDPFEVQARLHEVNERLCTPPLPRAEVEAILRSIWRRDREQRELRELTGMEPISPDELEERPGLTEDDMATLTPSQRSELVTMAWSQAGLLVPVRRVIAYEAPEGVEWHVALEDGREVSIGSDLLSQLAVRRAIANATGYIMPQKQRADWESFAARLLTLCERIEALPPGAEQWDSWIEMLIAERGVTDGDADVQTATEDLTRRGSIVERTVGGIRYRWVALGRVLVWLDVRLGLRIHQRTAATWARQAGWEPATWNDANGAGWRAWRRRC